MTSVILAPEGFDPEAFHESAPSGPRATDVTGVWTIRDVSAGTYLVLAGYERDGLVLVRGRRHPDYASAAVYNPIDLRARTPVYAWDASPELRAQVLAACPDRAVWIVDGPTLTGSGYRVVAGPVPPDSARHISIPPSAGGDDRRLYDPVSPHATSPP